MTEDNSDEFQVIIESQLPKQFLLDLGVYLQTCAHIEVAVCALICRVEGLSPQDETWHHRFHSFRKLAIKDLIPHLQKAGQRLPMPQATHFDEIVLWIKNHQRNRHIAAHGAFYVDGHNQKVKVLYSHKNRDENGVFYTADDAVISRDFAATMIHEADRLLRIISGLSHAVGRGELPIQR